MIKKYLKLLRPKHWIKNFFVLAPLLFSFKFLEIGSIVFSIRAFIIFSLSASSVYVYNDIIDRKKDALHPIKCKRPIANGEISVFSAYTFLALILVVVTALTITFNHKLLLLVVVYLLINIFYSLLLKKISIVDVFIISAGFVLRVIAGAVSIDVPVSDWMILMTIFISLFLGFSKRYNELSIGKLEEHRDVLGSYSIDLLNNYMIISSVLTIVIYIFYTMEQGDIGKFDSSRILYTIPSVVFGLLRYLQLVLQENQGGDVAEVVTKDKYLIGIVLIWIIQVIWAYQW